MNKIYGRVRFHNRNGNYWDMTIMSRSVANNIPLAFEHFQAWAQGAILGSLSLRSYSLITVSTEDFLQREIGDDAYTEISLCAKDDFRRFANSCPEAQKSG